MAEVAIHRLGEIKENKYGSLMLIEKYRNVNDITVKFIDNGNLVHTQYREFKRGTVRNVYDKVIYGVGYMGEGDFNSSINGKITQQYLIWHNMLKRCYDENTLNKHPAYNNCYVCEEWHNFQTFAKWYDENFYQIDDERMNLDKDILIKGNKIYSPDTCVFVPMRINLLFITKKTQRGNLPIGVDYHKGTGKYRSRCNVINKKVLLGYFDSPEEAFKTYKIYKEKLIKYVADEYKDRIPNKLYQTMIRYIVEIND